MDKNRHYSGLDRLLFGVDRALRTLQNCPPNSGKTYPANGLENVALSPKMRAISAALMRVNHAGEVCAQALYHAQAFVSKDNSLKISMQKAAVEEGDHLLWCKQRLEELGSHTSYLSPLWYGGSFCIGALAGAIGDAWSLGFLAETEQQVIKHLEAHQQLLPVEDVRSQKILQQMTADETAHRDEAIHAGAKMLPPFIKKLMQFTSKVMVKTAYWI